MSAGALVSFSAGRGECVVVALASEWAWEFRAVSSACRRPSSFLFACPKRKEPKRKGTPVARPPGLLPYGYAGGLRGFSTGLLSRRKTGRHPCRPSCGLSFAHPPRHRGPGTAARSQRAEATATATAAGLRRLGLWRARCAPAFPGPLGDGEAGTTRPRSGRVHGWTRLFARAGARSKSPALPHALAGQEARQASSRGAFFSWLLLFWARKREVARAAPAARNRPETNPGAQS